MCVHLGNFCGLLLLLHIHHDIPPLLCHFCRPICKKRLQKPQTNLFYLKWMVYTKRNISEHLQHSHQESTARKNQAVDGPQHLWENQLWLQWSKPQRKGLKLKEKSYYCWSMFGMLAASEPKHKSLPRIAWCKSVISCVWRK